MKTIAALLILLAVAPVMADDLPSDTNATTPMPGDFEDVWKKFYFQADGEGSIIPNLMEGDKKMVPSICEAITDRRMRMRRYAIGALGYLRDRRAIPKLEAIYADSTENELFRGDALHAIFCIDQNLGTEYARSVLKRSYLKNNYLRHIAQELIDNPHDWIELPTS